MSSFNLRAQACGCADPAYNFSGPHISLSDLINTGALPPNAFTGPCLSINGTLDITEDYQLTGVDVIMTPGSSIRVLAGNKLTVDYSKFYGCDEMWTGILLEPDDPATLDVTGGILDMSNSSVRDAEYAIWARDYAYLRLVSNDLINNYIGLYVAPEPGNNGSAQLSLIGLDPLNFADNDFEYRANEPYLPYHSVNDNVNVGFAGIFFNRARNTTLGQNVNRIKGSRYGSYISFSTNVKLQKFNIDDLSVTNNTSVVTNQTGTGVRVNGSQIVKIIGCQMSEGIQNGIVTSRFEVRLEYNQNRITADNYGIYATTTFQMPNLDILINENIITANTGIQVQNIPYLNDYYRTMTINENTINPAVYGIYIANTGTDNEIYQNDIGLASEAGASGIVCDMVQGVGFTTHNTINWWPPQLSGGYGIHYSNTHDFHISENTIAATDAPYPYIECGIGLDNNYWGVICCNTLDYTSRGMYLTGTNSPFISILTNIFGNHKVGLEFAPNAVASPQLNPGNDWTAAACAIDAQYPGNLFQAQSNAFYRTDPANVPAMQIVPMGWFDFMGTDPSCSDPNYECNIIGATGEPGGVGENLLRGLDTTYAPGFEGARLMQHQALYRYLSEHPALIESSPAVSVFYNEAAAGFVGAWYASEQVRINLGRADAAQEADAAELADALQSAQHLLDSLRLDYQQASPEARETIEAELQAGSQTLAGLHQQLGGLYASGAAAYAKRLNDLLAQNAALDATNAAEENERLVNDLLIRLEGGLIDSFDTAQKAWIDALAAGCPQVQGPAVYKARRLQKEYAGHFFYDDSVNCGESARGRQQAASNQPAARLAVSPNPAGDFVSLLIGGEIPADARIQITDMQGRVRLVAPVQGNPIQIPVHELPNGAYFVSILSENAVVAVTRLNILK